jgi:hypothetical protein
MAARGVCSKGLVAAKVSHQMIPLSTQKLALILLPSEKSSTRSQPLSTTTLDSYALSSLYAFSWRLQSEAQSLTIIMDTPRSITPFLGSGGSERMNHNIREPTNETVEGGQSEYTSQEDSKGLYADG